MLSFKPATASSKGDKDATSTKDPKPWIMHRGAKLAFEQLSLKFGANLFDAVPKVWDCIAQVLMSVYGAKGMQAKL